MLSDNQPPSLPKLRWFLSQYAPTIIVVHDQCFHRPGIVVIWIQRDARRCLVPRCGLVSPEPSRRATLALIFSDSLLWLNDGLEDILTDLTGLRD